VRSIAETVPWAPLDKLGVLGFSFHVG
jgi:hypothetical protein